MKFLSDKRIKIILFLNNIFNKIIEKINIYKQLINYISILENIIKNLNTSIKIENKNNKCIIQNKIFKKQFTVNDKSITKINEEIYKYKTFKFKNSQIYLLTQITKQLEEEKQRETTVATIVHDLKSPIIACEKAIYLITQEQFGNLNEEQHKILEMCYRSLNFTKYLVGNILCNYKQSQQNFSLYIEDFDIVQTIKESVNELEIFSKEKNLNIFLNLPNSFNISADKNEIKRVILNLIYNALTYSYISSDVEIFLNYNEKTLSFYVKNKGDYVPPEEIRKIFKKNISPQNKYNKIGTGLGLYLSKEIILAHNGEMIAKSSPNNQNIFGFKLNYNRDLKELQKI